ncbi:MAG: hypothetical protein ACRD0F_05220 [Acidimicrobiales bacterium]
MAFPVLAHGGSAGLAIEIAFVAVPILAFAALARWAARREREEHDGGGSPPKEG